MHVEVVGLLEVSVNGYAVVVSQVEKDAWMDC